MGLEESMQCVAGMLPHAEQIMAETRNLTDKSRREHQATDLWQMRIALEEIACRCLPDDGQLKSAYQSFVDDAQSYESGNPCPIDQVSRSYCSLRLAIYRWLGHHLPEVARDKALAERDLSKIRQAVISTSEDAVLIYEARNANPLGQLTAAYGSLRQNCGHSADFLDTLVSNYITASRQGCVSMSTAAFAELHQV